MVSFAIMMDGPDDGSIECQDFPGQTSSGEVAVCKEPADRWLPWHLSTIDRLFEPKLDWIWLQDQFIARDGRVTSISRGGRNLLAYRLSAAQRYPDWQSLVRQAPGKRVSPNPNDVTLLHIASGPCPEDYISRCARFAASALRRKINSTCVIQLGRFGDIINILPVLKLLADRGRRPYVMVSRAFASVLEGVSYAIPHVVGFDNGDLRRALDIANNCYHRVLRSQITGRTFCQARRTRSYNRESWRELGFGDKFDDPKLSPFFDLRSPGREAALLRELANEKPMVLVKLTDSRSSPMPGGEALLAGIRAKWSDRFNIVDLSAVKAVRIYDLLGLFEAARFLITIDSAPLHLAAACQVPVLALLNPKPWLGSEPRCHCVAKMTYDEVSPETIDLHLELAYNCGFACIAS